MTPLPLKPPEASQALTIAPTASLIRNELTSMLGLRKSSVAREIRDGRLRVAKRCGQYFFLGSWVLEWLEGGEVKVKAPPVLGLLKRGRGRLDFFPN